MNAPSPEHIAQLQRLALENEALKAKLRQMEEEKHRQTIQHSSLEAPAFLPRAEFIREVARMTAHDTRYGASSSMVSFSFEGLEENESTMPGQLYDRIISAIAAALTTQVRACDIVGRTGAQDFAVYLTRCSEADAGKKAALLVAALQEKLQPLLENLTDIELCYAVKRVDAGRKP